MIEIINALLTLIYASNVHAIDKKNICANKLDLSKF